MGSGSWQWPEGFEARVQDLFGDRSRSIFETFVERPTTFRVNTLKVPDPRVVISQLHEQHILAEPIRGIPNAYRLRKGTKRDLTDTSAYKQGLIYLQSIASQVPPLALAAQPGDIVLDLCAAPGSKTTQMAAQLEGEGKLIACESNKVRFFKLHHNCTLLGLLEKEKFLELRMDDGCRVCGHKRGTIDKLLADVPCSGESRFIFGRDETLGYWSERKVHEMARKQRRLLFSAFHALRVGGEMVYSTCTLSPEENEFLVDKLVSRFPDAVEVVPVQLEGVTFLPEIREFRGKSVKSSARLGYRVQPTELVESFFISKLRKVKDVLDER